MTVTIELPATRTYAARCVYWIPSEGSTVSRGDGDDQHQLAALGKIRLAVVKGKIGYEVSIDTQVYAVQRVDTGRRDVASFLLLKLAAPGETAEVYEVTGGSTGRRCTCKAGSTGRGCKHLDGVAALVRAKHLPGPKAR